MQENLFRILDQSYKTNVIIKKEDDYSDGNIKILFAFV